MGSQNYELMLCMTITIHHYSLKEHPLLSRVIEIIYKKTQIILDLHV